MSEESFGMHALHVSSNKSWAIMSLSVGDHDKENKVRLGLAKVRNKKGDIRQDVMIEDIEKGAPLITGEEANEDHVHLSGDLEKVPKYIQDKIVELYRIELYKKENAPKDGKK